MGALLRTSLPDLPPPTIGKVREVYDLGDELLIVATDRISAFDVVMPNGIPDKGRVLNLMSGFWFNRLHDVCPNHVLSLEPTDIETRVPGHPELLGRTTIAKKARPLPVECVARGYITGSLLKEYRALGPNVHELGLEGQLVESSRLAEPIFSPATKASEGHDENIPFRKVVDLIGHESAEQVRDWTLTLYEEAVHLAASSGLILADTKFEFGETADGLIWIDEALTPDSSRFWEAKDYTPGRSQTSFDKQFVRDFLEASGWDKRAPGPVLPEDVVQRTRAKYVEAYERIVGEPFPT